MRQEYHWIDCSQRQGCEELSLEIAVTAEVLLGASHIAGTSYITCCTGTLLANAGESWQGDGSPLQQGSPGIQVPAWPVLDNQEIRVIGIFMQYFAQEASSTSDRD